VSEAVRRGADAGDVIRGLPEAPMRPVDPDMPADTGLARGFSDQYVILHSRRTVIVRPGWTTEGRAFDPATSRPSPVDCRKIVTEG